MKNNTISRIAAAGIFAVAAVLGTAPGCSRKSVSGTFTGTAKGMGGDVTVTLTLKDNVITDAAAEGEKETPDIGGKALPILAEELKDTNSVDIDTVSGATVTSNAVIEAAKAALNSAGLKPEDLAAVEVEDKGNQEITYSRSETYTGTANGYNGPMNLKVTFTDNGISDIDYSDNVGANHIGTPAFPILVDDAREAN